MRMFPGTKNRHGGHIRQTPPFYETALLFPLIIFLGAMVCSRFRLLMLSPMGRTSNTAGTFRKKFRKHSGKTLETLSERFLEFPSRLRLGCSKSYNSRHLRLSEHFQNYLPRSTAGDASFLRIGSGEGLSELPMEFPTVLGAFLIQESVDGGFQNGGWRFEAKQG